MKPCLKCGKLAGTGAAGRNSPAAPDARQAERKRIEESFDGLDRL